MKLRNFFELIGFRQQAVKYGYEIEHISLPGIPEFDYAHWLHPKVNNKIFSSTEFFELEKILTEGDFAIDIGAHTGDTAIPMGFAVGKSGAVLALEPNPYVYEVLAKNAELASNHCTILPLKFAASERDEMLEFEYSDPGYCNGGMHKEISPLKHGHGYKLKVEGVFLPAYLEKNYSERMDRLKYIKIDAEGYDLWIALTLEGVLKKYRPFVEIEVFKHTSEETRGRMFDFFKSMGYELRRVESASHMWGAVIERQDITAGKHFDMLCIP